MKLHVVNENTTVAQTMDLVAAEMDGETVMMNIESGKYFGLDTIGSRIWELIDSPRMVAEVVGILVQEYDVERGQCQVDTVEFLNHLYREGLVRCG